MKETAENAGDDYLTWKLPVLKSKIRLADQSIKSTSFQNMNKKALQELWKQKCSTKAVHN